ncbi:exopolysaccharide biosynthesis polyprenyl glycosylphosphotransferase [Hymenobacter sp. GOD-10R]|uniref:exopolysaccharide biosynthesis polyprenyl glycosylphosphotransferase n=1 Tax=Hymenobacter sp. GOD-10R TaxID=3093922 RepID=UPI002D79EDD9|nr:exopolysaccharide biosynthesis polyprenyl glycosylphosphotransferase [Hymenobacter sp. GOD-10R]WRQ28056.1 exopolysaccharide biosynthesis polyprenyl glycosylphosphotransferase [Hymenobacter sp. GOD-10R]
MAAYATLKEQGTMPNNFSYRQVEDAAFRAVLVKRVFDLLFASLVLIFLLSWLVPLIALLIKLDSKGPVFFKQLRTGKDGLPFYCFKFRSMRMSNDADHKQASRGDSRITRLGAILRKTSLDELPQFINVLRGEMSVVGPRPHMLKHTEDYARVIDNFMVRHAVMPGITGLAQVAGHRGETKELTAMTKRVNADIFYIKNWSFLLDVKIVLLTVKQAVKGSENAF